MGLIRRLAGIRDNDYVGTHEKGASPPRRPAGASPGPVSPQLRPEREPEPLAEAAVKPVIEVEPAPEPLTPPEPDAPIEVTKEELGAAINGNGKAEEKPEPKAEIKLEQTIGEATAAADEDADEDDGRLSAEQVVLPERGKGKQKAAKKKQGKRAKVISFANQKGGVAKTTTTLNLAVAFKESGHKVLCIDLDPQGNLTMSQGIDPDQVEQSMFDVLVHDLPISKVTHAQEIDIAVSSIDLAGAEIAMSTMIGRERALEKALDEVSGSYDFVCIDTPPSLGLLTINALTASDKVIVPVQCEYLSMRGLVQLQNTLEMIRENLNPGVTIEGILPTMLDSRTVHAKEAVEILEENFGDLVFKSRIRKTIKFAEAPVRGSSVLKYDPTGKAAEYYRELAKEVLAHGAS